VCTDGACGPLAYVPRTAADYLQVQCGAMSDGCGNSFSMKNCGEKQYCETNADQNKCLNLACMPTDTYATQDKQCGMVSNGCGGFVSCSSCQDDQICNVSRQCVTPQTCVPKT